MPRRAFTLVEMMIVVAIIGVLAALAIPNYFSMQYRAKRAEIPVNVDGIRTAEIAYELSAEVYVEAAEAPGGPMNKKARDWNYPRDFQLIGYSPSGRVRGNYKVELDDIYDFLVTGNCDLDANGDIAEYTATKSINATMMSEQDVY